MFDAQSFLDQTINEANDTTKVPCPVGEYTGIVSKVDCRQWTKKDDPTVNGVTLDVTWEIDDQGVREILGRDKVICRQGIMLDITSAGGLDSGKGKNIGLGRLREALNLNTPGVPFSFNMLVGRLGKVRVTHRANPNDPEQIFDEVTAVTKL